MTLNISHVKRTENFMIPGLWFSRCANGQTDRKTDKQTKRRTTHLTVSAHKRENYGRLLREVKSYLKWMRDILSSKCCSLREKIAKNRYWPLEVFRMASAAPTGKAGAKGKVCLLIHLSKIPNHVLKYVTQ